ncbi:MAG: purine-cytosine permease family protein [Candidatus Dormibacteraceae bacterium]
MSAATDRTEGVGAAVPVREGLYGQRVVAVEPGGVEYIPAAERHGRPRHLFRTWMSPNLEFATVFVGCIGVYLFGGSFWEVAAAAAIGTALGALTHAVLSSWGPRFGVPQMVQGRAAFGFYGNALPAGLMSVTAGIGWFAVNSLSASLALSALVGFAYPLSLVIIVAVQIAIAFFGHNLVQRWERYAFIPLAIVFALACGFIFAHANFAYGPRPPASGGQIGAFILTAAAAFGYACGWNPYASDYTRYLPASCSRLMTGVWAGLGVFVSCTVMEVAGAALVTVAGTKWFGTNPTAQLHLAMPQAMYDVTLLCIALGGISANALNIYSGSMSFLTLGINIPSHLRRAIVALGFGVVGFVVAYTGLHDLGGKYQDFLLVISYWIGPWLGVILVDYVLRRGRFGDETIFYDRGHRNWAGPVALVVGGVLAVYLFSNQALYTGPLPKRVPQLGDLTFLVGFVLAALTYYLLRRRSTGSRVRSSPEVLAGSPEPVRDDENEGGHDAGYESISARSQIRPVRSSQLALPPHGAGGVGLNSESCR